VAGKLIDLDAWRRTRDGRPATPAPFVLRCTAKLGRALPFDLNSEVPDTIPRLNQWHARLVDLGRRNFVLVTNSETLYSVVLLDVDEDTLYGFDDIVLEAIAEQVLHDELIKADSPDEAIAPRAVLLDRSDDRRVLGSMNDLSRLAEGVLERSWGTRIRERQLASDLNQSPMSLLDMDVPLDRMRTALSPSPW